MKKLLYILLFVPLGLFGQDNYSLSFDESNKVMLNDINLPALFTIETNVKVNLDADLNYGDAGAHIFSIGASSNTWATFAFGISNNTDITNLPLIVVETGHYSQPISNSQFPLDQWVRIIITYENSHLKVYQNGLLVLDEVLVVPIAGPTDNVFIGSRGDAWQQTDYNFNGNIDFISYYNRIFTEEEIQCATNINNNGLSGYWNFNEGSGDTVYDISGNDNHGVIYGATYRVDVPEDNCDELIEIEDFSYLGSFDGSNYYLSNNPNYWEDAHENCLFLGGGLLTISSIAENTFILESINSSNLNVDDTGFWIGLILTNNEWGWISNEILSFINWDENEPSSPPQNYGQLYTELTSNNDIPGSWDDTGQGLKRYILEINNVTGCTDSLSFNYNEYANINDDSCYPVILGCIDSTAFNYNTPIGDLFIDVNTDDGSCISQEEFTIDSLQQALAVFQTVEEEQDYSMSFDGVNDYIDLGQSNVFEFDSSSFSVSINFKSFSYEDSRIIGNYNGNGQYPTWNIGVSRPAGGLGHLYLDLRSPGVEFYGNIDVCDGLWHNIVLVRNGNNFSVFVDGVADINSNHIIDNNDVTDNTNIILGKANVIEQEFLNAKINNLIIFNKPLNSYDIETLQVCPPSGQEDGLVGYWDFNEGIGDTVYDISGNGNHGLVNGAEFSEDVPESFNGCTDTNALNFDATAQCDKGSCVYGDDEYSALESDIENTNSNLNNVIDTWQSSIDLTSSTLDEVSLINQTLSSFNTVIDLTEGWNMFGYGCPQPMDVVEGLSIYTDLIIITKDNNGSVYMPEFSFNGIGSFSPGYGYQTKISEAIEGFSLCGDFINTDNTQILDIETENAQMQNDINCLTGNPEIGDHCYGGIVFYVEQDEYGKYGLVVYDSIFTQGAQYFNDQYNTYAWGCSNQEINGADNLTFGYGHKNTLDIELDCNDENSIANLISSSNLNNYNDWFIPSLNELSLVVDFINDDIELSSLYNEDYQTWFWSSSESEVDYAWSMNINSGEQSYHMKNSQGGTHGLIPIRSFGNWTIGCMDSLACNYNSEANMADGNCAYAEQGYNCEGNIQSSLIFDGYDDFLNLGYPPLLDFMTNSSFTISSWFFIDPSNSGTLYRRGDGWSMSQNRFININQDLNTIIFSIRSTGNSSAQFPGCNYVSESQTTSLVSLEINDPGWYYLSCIRNFNQELIIQIDSIFESSDDNSGPFDFIESCSCCGDEWVSEGIPNHLIGASRGEENGNWLNNNHFVGMINNLQIWNTVLTSDEIENYKSCPPSGNEEGLVGYWNFNDNEGDTVYDITGNGNHGTINGQASFSTDVPENNCE